MKELSVQLYKELTKNAFLIWNAFKVIVVNYVQAIWQSPVLNTIIKVWGKNTSTRQWNCRWTQLNCRLYFWIFKTDSAGQFLTVREIWFMNDSISVSKTNSLQPCKLLCEAVLELNANVRMLMFSRHDIYFVQLCCFSMPAFTNYY